MIKTINKYFGERDGVPFIRRYGDGQFRVGQFLSGQCVYKGQKDGKKVRGWCGLGIGLSLFDGDQDRDLGCYFKFFLFAVYLTLNDILPAAWQPKADYEVSFGATRLITFYYNDSAFWFSVWQDDGGSSRSQPWYMRMFVFDFPWRREWVRTSTLLKNQMWMHETPGQRTDWKFSKQTDEIVWSETHPYSYTLRSGEIQNVQATITVTEMEWRWKWFQWLPWTGEISKTIRVDFSAEVGEETGSYKGGTTGCGYEMKPGETPLECLRRMERERRFGR